MNFLPHHSKASVSRMRDVEIFETLPMLDFKISVVTMVLYMINSYWYMVSGSVPLQMTQDIGMYVTPLLSYGQILTVSYQIYHLVYEK